MKVLIINGSPKMERSNSLKLTTAFVEGLCSACDAEVETITVAKLNINTCLGCLNCWKKTPGECFCYKNDDMAAANEKIIAADVVIWSFPLYYYSLPGLLKVFIDRQVPTMRPIMQERIDGKGNGKHASRYDLSHQRHILISTCGFCYYKGNYDAVKAQFDLILGVDNYTTLFCGQGEMLPVPFLKDRVDEYLGHVRKAGVDYAKHGCILPATRTQLDETILPKKKFEEMADSYYAHCAKKAAEAAAKAAAEAEAAQK